MHFNFYPILGLVFTMIVTSSEAASWEALPKLPLGVGNAVCGMMDNDLIVAGGITWTNDTKIWLDKIWRFDGKQKVWHEAGKLPQAIAYPSFGQNARGIYFAGGADGKKCLPQSGFLDHELKFHVLGAVPQPLIYSACTVADGKLYVLAGAADPVDLQTTTNIFYSVDLKSGRIDALPDFPGGKVIVPTAAASRGRIYAFAGASINASNQAVNLETAFVYSIADAKWSAIKSVPISARGMTSCVLDENHIFLAGGYGQDFNDDAFIYDVKADSYTRTLSLPYRGMVSLIKSGNDLYCFGGEDKMRHRSDLFYRIPWKALLPAR
jgi:N-acetylneuraminic acid mutarotase